MRSQPTTAVYTYFKDSAPLCYNSLFGVTQLKKGLKDIRTIFHYFHKYTKLQRYTQKYYLKKEMDGKSFIFIFTEFSYLNQQIFPPPPM